MKNGHIGKTHPTKKHMSHRDPAGDREEEQQQEEFGHFCLTVVFISARPRFCKAFKEAGLGGWGSLLCYIFHSVMLG